MPPIPTVTLVHQEDDEKVMEGNVVLPLVCQWACQEGKKASVQTLADIQIPKPLICVGWRHRCSKASDPDRHGVGAGDDRAHHPTSGYLGAEGSLQSVMVGGGLNS